MHVPFAAVALCAIGAAMPLAAQDWCGRADLGAAEQAICADSVLGSLDARLNEAYARVPASDRVEAAQRDWIATRNACGFDIFCIEAAYKSRIDALRDQMAAPAPTPAPAPAGNRRPWCSASGLNQAERTVCNSDILSNMDAAMEAVYGRLRAADSDQSQIDWLGRRNDCGTDETCIGQAYLSRIIELGGRLRTEG